MKLQRILLPTDFSALSERAAETARALAQANDATVHVLHVAEPIEITVEVPEIGFLRRRLPPHETLLRNRLDAFAREHVGDFRVPVVPTLIAGEPSAVILRYARETEIDRIVIGTHAKGIVRRMIHGSVSKAVLEQAQCPVLLVPQTVVRFATASTSTPVRTPALAASG